MGLILTLVELDKLITQGRYDDGLRILDCLYPDHNFITGDSLRAPDKQKAQYLALKLFNRKQWLVEANVVEKALAKQKKLSHDELLELALYRVLLGQPAEARRYFKLIIKRYGNEPLVLSEIAFTYDQQAKQDKAKDLLGRLTRGYLKKNILDDTALRVFLRLAYLCKLDTDERRFLERHYEKSEDYIYSRVAHILAIDSRRKGDTDKEIDYLLAANQHSKKTETDAGVVWSMRKEMDRLKVIESVFSDPTPKWLKEIEPDKTKMLLVLGMPRSGTTLLEQILGAHSQVGNCGESLAMSNALTIGVRQLGGVVESGEHSAIRNLRHFTPAIFKNVQSRYLNYQHILSKDPVFSDKQLALVDFVGLMVNLFPNARVVYIERDPLDNCVSLMQRDFKNAPYSNDPLHIVQEGEFYKKRMAYWMTLFPDKIYSLKYEELVSDPDSQFPKLIKACGLDWEPEILNFHERQNSVRTPSASQVRAKLNTDAVEKWRQYERLIQPAIDYLGR